MQRLRNLVAEFPRQFWILFGGTLVNSVGSGMVFPFLTLYLHQHLNLSMTMVGAILTLWAVSSLLGQLVGGSLTDRIGRKVLMVSSLAASVVLLPLFGLADTVAEASVVVLLLGAAGALYQPARDAMVADLVGSTKRPQAYGLVRVVNNLGLAIGPAIGGFLAARSFQLSFVASAGATLIFFLMSVFMMRETKPVGEARHVGQSPHSPNFLSILRNVPFVLFLAATTFVVISYVQMMTVLPVYMKDQFSLGENYFGWVMTTNAGMVVLFQFPITLMTAKRPRLKLIAVGALLYAIGVGSVALANNFEHFIVAMAITTLGEMITVPTATAVTADLAPQDLRGRYMSALGLTWNLGFAMGPVFGGVVSDQIAPRALWPIMSSAALAGAAVYLLLARFVAPRLVSAPSTLAE